MICRLWRGWTTPENAAAYEHILRGEVIPGIEARNMPGFRAIDVMKRDSGDEVEFQTLMWFDNLDLIKAFVGEDYSVSHVPDVARAVLKRFDSHAAHYEVVDRRDQ
ncbi:MAG: antibiotic biosynthesis monooxygenase [Sphingomonas sp.]|nr:antibiotic biosynthesis monooxygenase [Sphingomonas sp.]